MADDKDLPKDISIEHHFWPAKRGVKKLTLVITFDALYDILTRESAVVSQDDVGRLLGAIHGYAAKADRSEEKALQEWDEMASELEEDDPDEEREDE